MGYFLGALVIFFLFGFFQSKICISLMAGATVFYLFLGWLQAREEARAKTVRASATRAEARVRRTAAAAGTAVDEDVLDDAKDAAEACAARHDGRAKIFNRSQVGVWVAILAACFSITWSSCPGAGLRDKSFSELDRLGTGPKREELIVFFPVCEAPGASQQAFIDLRLPDNWETEVFPAGGSAEDPSLRAAGARAIASRRCPVSLDVAVAEFAIASPHRVWSEGDRPPSDPTGARGLRWMWEDEH